MITAPADPETPRHQTVEPAVEAHADHGTSHPPELDQLRHHPAHRIDGDGESDARVGARRRVDGGVHADQPSRAIEKRPARVAGVDGGVGLDHVFDRSVEHAGDGPAERAHDSGGQGVIEAEGVADGEHLLSDLEVGAAAEGQGAEFGPRGLHPDDGEVEFGRSAHQGARQIPVTQGDPDFRRTGAHHGLDHVVVGHDVPLVVPDETRARTRRLFGNGAAPEVDLLLGGGDERHRGLGVLEKGDGGLLVGIEIARAGRGCAGSGLGFGHRRAGDRFLDVLPKVGSERCAEEEGRKEDASKSHGRDSRVRFP
jgi:hypothetical protein